MAKHTRQQLLVDTDGYCKLSIANLFADAIAVLGVSSEECGRLPALPYMLRRGGLRKQFGDVLSDAMIPEAEGMPIAMQPDTYWLDPLTAVSSIDPGEAQLLAASAEYGTLLLTGDKRGLHGVKDIPGYSRALDGRVVVLEAMLIALCGQLGVDTMRSRVRDLMDVDTAVGLCFSDSKSSPLVGLMSYYRNLAVALSPLNLWRPSPLRMNDI